MDKIDIKPIYEDLMQVNAMISILLNSYESCDEYLKKLATSKEQLNILLQSANTYNEALNKYLNL